MRNRQRAAAYVNALGYYELYVNGKKVDDAVLAPAVVDYSRRNWYVTHDIASYLVKGRNYGGVVAGPRVVCQGPSGRGVRRAAGARAVGDRAARRKSGERGNR